MVYVFVDESGDLGFNNNASNYYVITFVETSKPKELVNIAKKVRKTLRKKKNDIPEFKFSGSDNTIRMRFLKHLLKTDATYSAVILQKRMVYNPLRERREKLHNYLAGFLGESLINEYEYEPEFNIIVDKFMNKNQIDEFNWYLRRKMSGIEESQIRINHEDSRQHAGLQAADFVAGSIFQYYERDIAVYYNLIQPRLRAELRKWF